MAFACTISAVATRRQDDATDVTPGGHGVWNGSPHPIAFVEIEVKQPPALKPLPTT